MINFRHAQNSTVTFANVKNDIWNVVAIIEIIWGFSQQNIEQNYPKNIARANTSTIVFMAGGGGGGGQTRIV